MQSTTETVTHEDTMFVKGAGRQVTTF